MTAIEEEQSKKVVVDIEDEDEEQVDDSDEDESTEGDIDDHENDADDDDMLHVDDDFALLALAKQRLSVQQAKEEAESAKVAAEESEGEDSEDDEDNASDCSERANLSRATSPERTKTETETPELDTPLVVQEEKKEEHTVTFEETEEPLRRRQRDENAELWALLQQSKFRIQSTRNLVIQESDIDESETGAVEDETSVDDEVAKPETSPGVVKTDEQRREEERQRKFQKENRELWELLQKSKNRLEEAAKAKIKEAAKAAAADVVVPAARIENPYKDIDAVPDEAESEDALTQKELLLAMAVAEEAARSGKEVFETPSKAELRNRDINSFDFIKKEMAKVPETPIGNDAKEEERERNRLALLTQALSNKWTSFRARVGDLDISQRQPRLGHQS